MDDVASQLVRCFSAVFPDLSEDAIRKASLTSVPNWDSISTVTLVALIDEQFGIVIEPNQIGELTSFESILEFLRNSGTL